MDIELLLVWAMLHTANNSRFSYMILPCRISNTLLQPCIVENQGGLSDWQQQTCCRSVHGLDKIVLSLHVLGLHLAFSNEGQMKLL